MYQNGNPDLLRQFQRYNVIIEESQASNRINLENVTRFRPTCLSPLLIFAKNNSHFMDIIMPRDVRAADLFRSMLGSTAGHMGGGSDIPFVVLPKSSSRFDPFFQRICEMGGDYCRKEKFRVMVDEVTNNTYLHSQFNNALVSAQHFPDSDHIEFCIMDDGITIGGSLRRAGMMLADGDALLSAVNGLSSRKEVGRGFGLRESISTLTKEYHAQVLLASGQAIFHFDQGGPKGFLTRDSLKLRGTLISIRLPHRP